MTSVVPKFQSGPVTYQVAEAVDGGQVVEARTGGLIGVAGAGSAKVLGVAAKKAAPDGTYTVAGTTGSGYPAVDVSVGLVSSYTPVWSTGDEVPVKYAAAATFGAKLKAAAAGTVTPWVSGTDAADLIIGHCAEPAGVAINATGLVHLY